MLDKVTRVKGDSGAAGIAVVGGGPAGLMAADTLAARGARVTLYDRMPSLGRKFLLAGRGGLNLTHSEPMAAFLARYREASSWLAPHLAAFAPADLRRFADDLGAETFVGSSGRVFPKAMKASPLLRAWLARLSQQGVVVHARHRLIGLEPGLARFETPEGPREERPGATILALGGASWPRLGADGDWAAWLQRPGVAVTPLVASNVGVHVRWSAAMRERHAGAPLKRIAVMVGGARRRGEAVVTARGLEGGVIYALSADLRAALASGPGTITVDLRPDEPPDGLARRLASGRAGQTTSDRLRRLGLDPAGIALLREGHGPTLPRDPLALAGAIKAVPITVEGLAGLDRAISTAGGVARAGLDERLMLTALPGVFVAGEMIDWDAPTGGYLLQASFATGRAAATGALDWLAAQEKAGEPRDPPA